MNGFAIVTHVPPEVVLEDYLTTRELADLLRVKERKIYDLATEGAIPCTRATGKLLFPRGAVQRWLGEHSSGMEITLVPALFSGSHDPLLEWAIRQCGCGIASIFDGSMDGMDRMRDGQTSVAAIHLYAADSKSWNLVAVEEHFSNAPVVLCEWVYRQRGLICGANCQVREISHLPGQRMVARQAQAGSQLLLAGLLADCGLNLADIEFVETAHSEVDAALAVQQGSADCAFGLQAMAQQFGLRFQPLVEERFDLLVQRRFWFEPAMQRFLAFCHSAEFRHQANRLAGYRLDKPLAIRFNGKAG